MKTINLFLILIILFALSLISNAQVTQQWASRFNGPPGNSSDVAGSLVLDASGNVYVTGTSDGDYATIKYNSACVRQWVQRYNGPGNSSDEAYSIAVDGSGNVYVSGYSRSGSGSGTEDYATIKYNSAGIQQWAARYNGAGNNSDFGNSIAVDASGNVYVTGQSVGSGTNYDYATIKYNSGGVQQWVQVYNGPGNNSDAARSITIDGSGNVYVTGYSMGSGTVQDYATIKYNSTGIQQWVSRYNGPDNSSDNANSIEIDGSGNVYITGGSRGSGTNQDYATIKYNSAGTQQWVSRYNGPGNDLDYANSLAVDASGNIYVTGYSIGSGAYFNYATIKYNSAGSELWVQRINSGTGSAVGRSIAVDGSGNVFVTGNFFDYLGGGTDADYLTMKYSPIGQTLFYDAYQGQGPIDEAYSTAVDASGNVYVTGYSRTGSTSATADYVTIKYNSVGSQLWASRYNGPGNNVDEAYSIAVDGSGNVYVTGTSSGSGSGFDCTTIKYNSAGAQQWAQVYNGPGNSSDEGRSIAVDASGNVYVTGKSVGSGTNYDYQTIKYNSAGVQQWAARYNGTGGNVDAARFLKLDASGNVYVTGTSVGVSSTEDYATVKYNSSGVQQWASRYDGPASGNDNAYSLAVDASGNVYITGRSLLSVLNYDYATVKYNSAGVQQWASRYNGPANGTDEALSIIIDASGNSYITGHSAGSGSSQDYATIKYNSAGAQQWASRYNGPGNSTDFSNSIGLDALGNVYVTGQSTGTGANYDCATLKYSISGAQMWEARYNGTGNGADYGNSLLLDASGNIYVTGASLGAGSDLDFLTIKYSQLVGIQPESNEIPDEYFLYNNYPNPFNPVTNIKFQIPTAGFVKLSVFDLLGREVETLVNEKLSAGIYYAKWSASNYPSGVYFYKMQYGSINEVKKMIMVK